MQGNENIFRIWYFRGGRKCYLIQLLIGIGSYMSTRPLNNYKACEFSELLFYYVSMWVSTCFASSSFSSSSSSSSSVTTFFYSASLLTFIVLVTVDWVAAVFNVNDVVFVLNITTFCFFAVFEVVFLWRPGLFLASRQFFQCSSCFFAVVENCFCVFLLLLILLLVLVFCFCSCSWCSCCWCCRRFRRCWHFGCRCWFLLSCFL